MIDFSKYPREKLTKEEQEQFERRAKSVDDNDNPPVVLDKEGNYIF